MADEHGPATSKREHSGAMLRVIGLFKLTKALTLVTFGVIVLLHVHTGFGHWLRQLATELGFVGTERRIADLIEKLGAIEAAHGVAIGIGALIYAALFVVEGTGLMLRKVWGEYVASIMTASFIPLEIYELVEHGTVVKVIVVAINIAIVAYLVLRLRRDGHWPFRHRRGTNGHALGAAVGERAGT
jgi:uncharacterized membrane protein (DUF2068 family)